MFFPNDDFYERTNHPINSYARARNYFSSKITSHIGYLITVSIAFATIFNQAFSQNITNFLRMNLWVMIQLCLITGIYIFGRACYWSALTNAILLVKPYDENYFKKLHPWRFETEQINRYGYNLLLAFQEASVNYLKRKNIYEYDERTIRSKFASLFSGLICKIIFILIGVLILLINYLLYFVGVI